MVTPVDSSEVVAYYAWCMASIAAADAPERLRKGAGRYPQPVALLARLGVSVLHEGSGLGAGLLADVLRRTARAGRAIGCRGLVVHAETDDARGFYLHLVPEFEPSPTDPLHLVTDDEGHPQTALTSPSAAAVDPSLIGGEVVSMSCRN